MADNRTRVTASVTAADDGTDWLQLRGDGNFFDISVSGTYSGTVTLQRKRPGESASAARDIEDYAATVERVGEMQGHWDVRLYIKAGELSSGSVELELGT